MSHFIVFILNNREILTAEVLGWGNQDVAIETGFLRMNGRHHNKGGNERERALQRLFYQYLNSVIQVQPIIKPGLFFLR